MHTSDLLTRIFWQHGIASAVDLPVASIVATNKPGITIFPGLTELIYRLLSPALQDVNFMILLKEHLV